MRHDTTPEWAQDAADAWEGHDDALGPVDDASEDAETRPVDPEWLLEPPAAPRGLQASVGRLLLAATDLERAEAHLAASVDRARRDGASWALIGRACGLTGEGARRRFLPGARTAAAGR